jgi:hypothetical protein
MLVMAGVSIVAALATVLFVDHHRPPIPPGLAASPRVSSCAVPDLDPSPSAHAGTEAPVAPGALVARWSVVPDREGGRS